MKERTTMSRDYRALSLIQPWAWLVLHAGKTLENRTWRWAGPYPRRVLLHASKSYNPEVFKQAFELAASLEPYLQIPPPEDWPLLPRGGFVGAVTVTDCVRSDACVANPWAAPDSWCYQLARPREVPLIDYRGEQGFFRVPTEVVARIARRL